MARCPVLVERDGELRTLSKLASEGGARLVVVTGEAGTGKSRLVREFAASLPPPWTHVTATLTRTRTVLPALPAGRPLAVIVQDAHFLEPSALSTLADGSDGVLTVLEFRLGAHPSGSAELRALARLVRDPRV
ncbi:MAG TPA: AAA family ATPase, partial [Solirubrobacter sp.]|nr:AAA family ATPase [Solirubrobacter sp.]